MRAGCVGAALIGLAWCATVTSAQERLPSVGLRERPKDVVALRVVDGAKRVRVEIETLGKIDPQVYQVGGPARLVVDVSGIAFRLPYRLVHSKGAVVGGLRYGLMAPRRGRIVADLGRDVQIAAVSNEHLKGDRFRVSIDLAAPARGGERTAALASAGPGAAAGPALEKRARRVVVIDPGHGGFDPGAVVNRTRLEKAIVLAVGLRVRRLLEEAGRVDVVMTRRDDTFLSLDERIERSQEAHADLFLSLHADAVEEGIPGTAVGGATVYVLSQQASDEVARRMAEKENAVDRLAGIVARPAEDNGVRNILADLLKRETESEAKRLRSLLVVEMRRVVPMSHQPLRSAAFHVLKQAETPSALIELGYMTNPVDLGLMRQEAWRDRVAKAIVKAVHRYFEGR